MFKIRFVALIIAFFALFFFVGLLKGALAYYTCLANNECYAYKWERTAIQSTGPVRDSIMDFSDCSAPTFEYIPGRFQSQHYNLVIKIYRWTGTRWFVVNANQTGANTPTSNLDAVNYLMSLGVPENLKPEVYLPDGPVEHCGTDPCQEYRDDLINSCGGYNKVDWSIWKESNCTGKCKISRNANLGSPDQCQ